MYLAEKALSSRAWVSRERLSRRWSGEGMCVAGGAEERRDALAATNWISTWHKVSKRWSQGQGQARARDTITQQQSEAAGADVELGVTASLAAEGGRRSPRPLSHVHVPQVYACLPQLPSMIPAPSFGFLILDS